MNKLTSVSRIPLRICAFLILAITLTSSLSGCISLGPNNEQIVSTSSPVNITHTYYYLYNGTSYLTGIIENVGTQNLVDISLQAEGYANNTTYELGYAGPETGVNATILPGHAAPFMIKMSQVATGSTSTTLSTGAQMTSAISKTGTSTRNITINNSKSQTSTQIAKKYNYKILPPEYKLSTTDPYPLAISNNKTILSNTTISVSGEVYNGGTENVTSSFVAVAFYGRDGNVLGVFVSSPQGTLSPKGTAPFQIDVATSNFSISAANIADTEVYAYRITS
jgi:hypothetical protein